MSAVIPYIVLAVAAGFVLPTQAGINSRLNLWTQSPVLAAGISFAVGTAALFTYAVLMRVPLPPISSIKQFPWWIWSGGFLGAFLVAAKAINRIKLGRIDEESTANIGIIKGGVATNIVPAQLMLKGEIRSHSTEKLARYTDDFKTAFLDTIASWPVSDDPAYRPPTVDLKVESEYPAMRLEESDTVVETIRQAGLALGRDQSFIVAGGGSDANIFNGYGLPTAIVATGMTDVHTSDESVDLKDMVKLTELLYTIACM